MFFGILILTRILFIASMVFIIGYVFGSFSQNKTLTIITKVATILAIVLFIGSNVFLFRFAGRGHGGYDANHSCNSWLADSILKR